MMIIILQPDPDSQHIINISLILPPILSHEPIIGGFINEELNTEHVLHIFREYLRMCYVLLILRYDCVQEVVKAHHELGHGIWWNLKSRFIYPIGHQLWYFGQWVPKKWSILGISCFSQILSLFSKNGHNSLTIWPNFKFRTILETRTIAGSRKICLIWLFECMWSPEPSEAVDVGPNTQKPPS